jgi:hypothetical protein
MNRVRRIADRDRGHLAADAADRVAEARAVARRDRRSDRLELLPVLPRAQVDVEPELDGELGDAVAVEVEEARQRTAEIARRTPGGCRPRKRRLPVATGDRDEALTCSSVPADARTRRSSLPVAVEGRRPRRGPCRGSASARLGLEPPDRLPVLPERKIVTSPSEPFPRTNGEPTGEVGDGRRPGADAATSVPSRRSRRRPWAREPSRRASREERASPRRPSPSEGAELTAISLQRSPSRTQMRS